MTKEESIQDIVDKIFALESPKVDTSRKGQIHTIITTTINGDASIDGYLVINILSKNEPIVFGYILTNVRLIQFEINAIGEIKSASYILSKIIGGVERSLIDNGSRIDAKIKFAPETIVGLKYNSKNQEISGFFEKVEQSWIKGSHGG